MRPYFEEEVPAPERKGTNIDGVLVEQVSNYVRELRDAAEKHQAALSREPQTPKTDPAGRLDELIEIGAQTADIATPFILQLADIEMAALRLCNSDVERGDLRLKLDRARENPKGINLGEIANVIQKQIDRYLSRDG